MKRTLLSAGLALALNVPAWAQEPAPAAATDAPTSSVPAVEGERVISAEFAHRLEMGRLSRDLEKKQIELKIAQTDHETALANAPLPSDKPDVKAAQAAAPPPNVSPLMAGNGIIPVNPATLGIPPGADPGSLLGPPRPVGLIGDSVLFRMGKDTLSARQGDSVGGYILSKLEGRRVTLSSLTTPKTTVTVEVP